MVSIDLCDGKTTRSDLSLEQVRAFLGAKKQRNPSALWVDLAAPDAADWQALEAMFSFHPLALEDARKQNQRPKVDTYEDHLFLSVHAACRDEAQSVSEIDVFLGANYLVTIHNVANAPLEETRRRLEQHPEHVRAEPGFLLYLLLDAIVDDYFPAMDALDEEIDAMELAIYESQDAPDFRPAVALKKRLLLLRQSVAPLRDVLNQILRIDDPDLISPELRVFYLDVYDHTLRLVEQIDLHRDILSGVMDVMMSQTSNRLNQVMKTLTGISTILMGAALIAGIYGMNFKHMPELNWTRGYYGALAAMAAMAAGLALYFKKIKWF